MRKYALLKIPHNIKKVIIYDTGNGTYIFHCTSTDDVGATGDHWYESCDIAEEAAKEEYGVEKSDWIQVSDPLPNCQDDFIRPVRIVGTEEGNPRWGFFE
ncbi:MAG: hypothetical protein HQK53_18735, partial [Oligoflexia bacterium]|nr:hypothetical protein [Oligoflexia bacterium]